MHAYMLGQNGQKTNTKKINLTHASFHASTKMVKIPSPTKINLTSIKKHAGYKVSIN